MVMQSEERSRELEWRIAKLIRDKGYELWDIQMIGALSANPVLRVFIESEKGAGINDCVKVNNLLRAEPAIEALLGGDYHLEVSSPGMDRLLKTRPHFERFEGSVVRVHLKSGGQYKAKLAGYDAGVLTLLQDGDKIFIPEGIIGSVRVEPSVDFKGRG
ncbi:MAG: ribosome maturation factor RimP [Methylocella sp.]